MVWALNENDDDDEGDDDDACKHMADGDETDMEGESTDEEDVVVVLDVVVDVVELSGNFL